MKLFGEIKNSIYNPIYYRVVRSESTRAALGYYYRFTLTLSVVLTVIFAIIFVPLLATTAAFLKTKALASYPADLTVSITNGQASTTVAEPYVVPFSADWHADQFQNFLVIDTHHPFDLKKFDDYHTIAWLSRDNLVYYRDNGIVIEPLSRVGNLTVSKEKISSWITTLSPFLIWLAPLAVLVVFVGLAIGFSFYLLILLIVALLVMLVGHLKHVKLGYAEAYRVTLHAVTLPILLRLVLAPIFPILNLHFLPTLILLCLVAFNLKTEEELLALS